MQSTWVPGYLGPAWPHKRFRDFYYVRVLKSLLSSFQLVDRSLNSFYNLLEFYIQLICNVQSYYHSISCLNITFLFWVLSHFFSELWSEQSSNSLAFLCVHNYQYCFGFVYFQILLPPQIPFLYICSPLYQSTTP